MKFTTLAVAIAISTAALGAFAGEKTITLPHGVVGTILSENGDTVTYKGQYAVDGNGQEKIVSNEVFEGMRLVKTAAGDCFVVSQDVAFSDFGVGKNNAGIQLPHITSRTMKVGCPAK